MRCKCCDSKDAMLYWDDFYCAECRGSIADVIREQIDDDRNEDDEDERFLINSSYDPEIISIEEIIEKESHDE